MNCAGVIVGLLLIVLILAAVERWAGGPVDPRGT
jgi:hypothetical protein